MAKAMNVGADGLRTDNEVEELLLRIRGLVFVRAILEQRGAGTIELDEHRREIDRLRRRLAQLVAGGQGGFDAAA